MGPLTSGMRARGKQLFQSSAVVEGQALVDTRVVVPQRLHPLEAFGLLGGEVVALRTVGPKVVELPDVGLEVTPPRDRGVHGASEPTLVVDRALAEHRVELRVLARSMRVAQR